MKLNFFSLLALAVSITLTASASYKMQVQHLELELSGLESSIKSGQKDENELQEKHRKAIVKLRDLEEGLRKKEEKIQEIKNELIHFQRAQRQVAMENHEFQFILELNRLEALLIGAKFDLKMDEDVIMHQRQGAIEIVSEIERTRLRLSSLTVRARATDFQAMQVIRKIRSH